MLSDYGDSVIVCVRSGEERLEFSSNDEFTEWVTERLETYLETLQLNAFVNDIPHQLRVSVRIKRGWNPCEDCRCCLYPGGIYDNED